MSKWLQTTVGGFISLQRGYDLTEDEREPGNVPVMGAAGQNGFHSKALACAPGIVVGRCGGSFGQIHFAKESFWPHNTAMFVTDFKGNDPYFAYYFLKNLNFSKLNSGSAQPSLNRNYVYPVQISVPLPEEQKKIAAVLSALDAKIDLNNRINAELEALAKTIYDYWFVQFDFPDAEGRPYKSSGGAMVWNETLKRQIPVGWKAGNITAVAKLAGGGTPPKANPKFWNGEMPFFTPADAAGEMFQLDTADHITDEGLAACSSQEFKNGTVFITARGSVGKVVIAGEAMAMNQSCYALCPASTMHVPFLYFHAQMLVHSLKVKASGSTFNSIVTNDIEWTDLVIPPPEAMLAFSEKAGPMFERILSGLRENKQLTRFRDWLLPLLMNGQVTVA